MTLDKSSELILDDNLINIREEFKKQIQNTILCSEPFYKVEFLNKLINSVEGIVLVVDLDLLLTGYVNSGIIKKKDNITILNTNEGDLKREISETVAKISLKKSLVIIDSLNGFYNVLNDKYDSAKFINSCIMLLASIAKKTGSTIIVTSTARRKDSDTWVTTPGGKKFVGIKESGFFLLNKIEDKLLVTRIDEKDKILKKYQI